ncbi:MAG: crossover junction endodeoxyribonuclease RuvC [Alphaproteobacteria bacterium]|nr:crossover junction endodeoxyribonuclease RuvC [Alphaproteobacteria bacterium]OJV47560.1 MAG: crossover junction endodeoxyribonuclease RuvC [Alphaproteobacteria bacterium 43-37]
MIKIIGIDPGLRNTGWGVIGVNGNHLHHIGHGVVRSTDKGTTAARLAELFKGLQNIIETHEPHEAAVEETFVNMNPTSTLKLGLARGMAIVVPALRDIPVAEYSANRIKKAVVGVGHADKKQMGHMVQVLLPMAGEVKLDAADALAVAICHAHFRLNDILRGQK